MKTLKRTLSLLLIFVLLAAALSACSSSKKLVGTWNSESTGTTLVLANDGTGSITEDGMSGSVRWSVEKDSLFLTISICGMTETSEFTYKLSGSTLTLIDSDGEAEIFQKGKH